MVTGCAATKVVSGSTKCALLREASSSSLAVDAADQYRTTKRSELYSTYGVAFSISFKEVYGLVFRTTSNIVIHETATYSPSYTERVSDLIFILFMYWTR